MDSVLYYATVTPDAQGLFKWFDTFDHGILRPDYHRVQMERWLWDKLHGASAHVLDIAQDEAPRDWLEISDYRTYGLSEDAHVRGDLLDMPGSETLGIVDAIICTEVLEHCGNPMKACREMHRALKPGGTLYAAAPFCWPDHRTDNYPDYWRFTEQGWELMLEDFDQVVINPTKWTTEGEFFYHMIRRFECMGFRSDVDMKTGYMVEAKKAQ